jgi:ABC-type lipoprotein release transport system permease subunit
MTKHHVNIDSQTSGTEYGDIVEASATDYVDHISHLQKAELAVASNDTANVEVRRVASEQQRNEEKLASNQELEEQVKRQEGMIRILQEQV